MNGKRIWLWAVAAAGLTFLPACEEMETGQQAVTRAVQSVIPHASGWWDDDAAAAGGSTRIIVYLSEQKAYFYKGGHVVGITTVSTGKPGFSTPPGHYHIISKDRDHVSSEFGDYIDDSGNIVKQNIDARKDRRPPGSHFDGARMPFCMHFNGGYAMHEGYVPPYAASHGCIRLPKGMAENFFNAAHEGTPVIVRE